MSDNLKAMLITGTLIFATIGSIIYGTTLYTSKKTEASNPKKNEVIIYKEDGGVIVSDPIQEEGVISNQDNKNIGQQTDKSDTIASTQPKSENLIQSQPVESVVQSNAMTSTISTTPVPKQPIKTNKVFTDPSLPTFKLTYPASWSLDVVALGNGKVLNFSSDDGNYSVEIKPYQKQDCNNELKSYEDANSYPSAGYYVANIYTNKTASLSRKCNDPVQNQLINNTHDMIIVANSGSIENFIANIKLQK
jgi:hypothetical protein